MPARKSKKRSEKRAIEAAKRAASAIYKPLDPNRREIRLLTLHEATDPTKSISVKLRTVRSYPGIKYIALSYIWGDSHDDVDILVNGFPTSIGANLASALESFHQHKLLCGVPDGRPLPLWVDAISINQKDLRERSDQVAFMGDIYRNATHVFSWLGPPDEEEIDVALDLIADLTGCMDIEFTSDEDDVFGQRDTDTDPSVQDSKSEDFDGEDTFSDVNSVCSSLGSIHIGPDKRLPRGYTDLMDDFDEPDEPTVKRFLEEISKRPDLCIRDSEYNTGNKIWDAVKAFHFSPYWRRVWVQQEMALARATDHCHFFFCGSSHISMRDLDMFGKLTIHASKVGQRPPRMDETVWHDLRLSLFQLLYRGLDDVRQLRPAYSETRDTAYTILFIATKCGCKNPRDQVYALNAVLGLGMVPDYELSVKDVYLEWFHNEWEKVSSTPESLNEFISMILRYTSTSTGDHSENSLPSWLPNLSKIRAPGLGNKLRGDTSEYSIMPEQTTYVQGEVLNIHGCVCGTIDSLFPISYPSYRNKMDKLAHFFEQLEGFKKKQMQRRADMGAGSEPILENALIHTLFQGTDPRYDDTRKLEDWSLFWDVIRYSATEEPTLTGVSKILRAGFNEQVEHVPEIRIKDSQISQEPMSASLFIKLLEVNMYGGKESQLLMTDNGYVGRCQTAVRDEDKVCILNGVNYPVVLRKVNDHWAFVSMCYVYGISLVAPSEVIQRDGLEGQWFSIH